MTMDTPRMPSTSRLQPVVATAWLWGLPAPGLVHAAQLAVGQGEQNALHTAGVQASHILDLWRLTLGVCTAVFVAVLVAFIWALWRAPRASADTAPHLASLEAREPRAVRMIAWATGVSVVLLLVLLLASVATDRAMARLPLRDALHVRVTASQWWWDIQYDDADVSRTFAAANELHVPVGRPVILTLKGGDVIHSFWVPPLAGKKDLIPGRTAQLVLRADRPGVYRGQCAEFCGAEHARMAFLVVAEEPAQYEAWAAQQRQPAPPTADPLRLRGQQLFMSGTCVMCHNVGGTDASGRHAPDLTHVGGRRTLAAGTLANTPEALARWIRDPQRIKPGTNMPGHDYSPEDMQALVAWLEGLK
jgi:cytochrome c oxidase subunit 2